MASPQDEMEYVAALKEREATLTRIKATEAAIAAMGFVPADAVKQNQLLTERLQLLARERQLTREIGGSGDGVVGAHQNRQDVASRLQQMRQSQETVRHNRVMQTAVRDADLRERYGNRMGGMMAGAERFGQSRMGGAMRGGAMMAGGFIANATRSGFQGTVEQKRLDFEMKLLNRQFASAFKPLIEWFTWGVTKVRKFMEGLDGAGQNVVMIAGLLGSAAIGMRMRSLAVILVSFARCYKPQPVTMFYTSRGTEILLS